uniref:Rhodanese domain-containing protein n=1 Tax=Clytia hemisphaerica TaxID=252671 RepID=A0A7M5XFE2_9CNID
MSENKTETLRRIRELESELQSLRSSLQRDVPSESPCKSNGDEASSLVVHCKQCDLPNYEIEKYSRQMILPEVRVQGQLKLKSSSVLVVGTGGLGCPAALYLTSAGVGTVGLVDYDTVDLSNLHRQILHTEDKVGLDKVDSAIQYLNRLNSSTKLNAHKTALDSSNAMDIINQYDLVLDCTDNVATRYLLNDACIFAGKPLVSGSALRFEGQLIVYNYMNGPCYRCLYPTPPPPETVTNCSDGGVMGAVTGVIGSLQAMEAIKIITNNLSSFCGKLLLYDAFAGSFRSIKLRGRQSSCLVCSENPQITKLQDYELFCGSKATDKEAPIEILGRDQRITVKEYKKILTEDHLLVDCRPDVEYEICSLQPSINILFERLF